MVLFNFICTCNNCTNLITIYNKNNKLYDLFCKKSKNFRLIFYFVNSNNEQLIRYYLINSIDKCQSFVEFISSNNNIFNLNPNLKKYVKKNIEIDRDTDIPYLVGFELFSKFNGKKEIQKLKHINGIQNIISPLAIELDKDSNSYVFLVLRKIPNENFILKGRYTDAIYEVISYIHISNNIYAYCPVFRGYLINENKTILYTITDSADFYLIHNNQMKNKLRLIMPTKYHIYKVQIKNIFNCELHEFIQVFEYYNNNIHLLINKFSEELIID